MKKTIRKWFWVWQFDKEEKWLNEMAALGLTLDSVGYAKYIFQETEPGTYTCRLELLEHYPTHPESEQYIRFLEETGAEHVGSMMRWVYFRKKVEDGPFELYSDCAARVKHLQRIIRMLMPLTLYDLWAGINNLILYRQNRMAVRLVCACIVLAAGFCWDTGYCACTKSRSASKTKHSCLNKTITARSYRAVIVHYSGSSSFCSFLRMAVRGRAASMRDS